MTTQEIYRLVKMDIDFGSFPYRKNGTFEPTPGMREMLNQLDYQHVRVLGNEIENLETEKDSTLKEMAGCKKPYKQLEDNHYARVKILENRLSGILEELALKRVEFESLSEELEKRGMLPDSISNQVKNDWEIDEPEQTQTKDTWSKKKRWMRSLSMMLVYILIELFTYTTQYDSLRGIKSIEEVGSRVLAMFMLVLLFHLVTHLAKAGQRPIYKVAMWVYLVLIGIMMFAPTTLHFLYPEHLETPTELNWTLEENDMPSESHRDSEIPLWVVMYRKMEWAPSGLGILLFLVVFFIVPNPYFNKDSKKKEQSNVEKEWAIPPANRNPEAIKWVLLKGAIERLSTERDQLELEIQKKDTLPDYLIPLLNKLEVLDKRANDIVSEVKVKLRRRAEIITEIKSKLSLYQTQYMDILSGNEVKRALLKPEWPEINDILNYYKI